MNRNEFSALCGCVVFRSVPESDVRAILRETAPEICDFAKHADIFTPSGYRKALAVILKGSAGVYKDDMLMSVLTAGDVFGMAALFGDAPDFPTTVRARSGCRVLFIPKEQLERIFAVYPVCVRNYIGVLSEKIRYLNEKIDRLASPSVTDKLRSFLEDAAQKAGSDEFTLPLSLSELAAALSAGRTSLYRAMDELTDEGFMERNGKNIRLLKGQKK